MKTTMIRNSLVVMAAALMISSAQAANLTLMGGANWTHMNDGNVPSGQVSSTTGAQLGWEGGMGLSFALAPELVTFEVDGIYDHSKQAYGSGSISANTIQIPAIFHLWLGQALAIGAGGFYEFVNGMLSYSDSSGRQLASGNPNAFGLTSNNYGALADMRIRFPMGQGHFFLDGRYLYGLKSLNSSGSDSLQSREAQAMLGYSFLFGGGGYR